MERRRYRAKLGQFFPPDHPYSPWMVRLAILRQDIEHEATQLGLKESDGRAETWRCVYNLRKLAITIAEVKDVLVAQVKPLIDENRDTIAPDRFAAFEWISKVIEDAVRESKPIRDALGAHVRPSNASTERPKVDHTVDVLRTHAEMELELALAGGAGAALHDLGMMSTLFAWPHVTNDAENRVAHERLSKHVLGSVRSIISAIDGMLLDFWTDVGLQPLPHDSEPMSSIGEDAKRRDCLERVGELAMACGRADIVFEHSLGVLLSDADAARDFVEEKHTTGNLMREIRRLARERRSTVVADRVDELLTRAKELFDYRNEIVHAAESHWGAGEGFATGTVRWSTDGDGQAITHLRFRLPAHIRDAAREVHQVVNAIAFVLDPERATDGKLPRVPPRGRWAGTSSR